MILHVLGMIMCVERTATDRNAKGMVVLHHAHSRATAPFSPFRPGIHWTLLQATPLWMIS